MDLLEDKVTNKKVNIAKFFPEFVSSLSEVRSYVQKFNADPFSVEDVKSFILYLFIVKKRLHNKQLYHHFTTAVDTKNVQYVFNSVKNTILLGNLDSLMLQWRKKNLNVYLFHGLKQKEQKETRGHKKWVSCWAGFKVQVIGQDQ